MATDTSAETRKVEGKLDALVNLVTQLAVSQKPASVARVCGIPSSNDHHANRRWLLTPSSFSARNDAIVIRGFHDLTTNVSAETRKVEGKQDALVNLLTQLAVNQKPASIARATTAAEAKHLIEKMASKKVEGKLDALVNLVTQLAQSGVNEHPEAYAANIYSRRPHQQRPDTCWIRWLQTTSGFNARNDAIVVRAVSEQEMTWLHIHQLKLESARNDAIVISGVHDVATHTSAETRKGEGKLDAVVNLVTQLAVNQKSSSVARVCGIYSSNDHHTNATTTAESRHLIRRWLPTPSSFGTRNDAIVIRRVQNVATDTSAETRKVEGVHDVGTDTTTETRKVEGKLDARVNLVTQLAQTGVNEHPEASAANIYSRPPQQQRPNI
ncbi:hypothetical protein Fmac_024897 [Flemingia macrophylla]|uniref:Uncharacterized protein n=1 Tax=Flemingia macrophylla TaxID=520843 RepID=A0ABD1LQP3_9FABA